VALGYRGSYDRGAAFARQWRRRQREAALTAGGGTFVPLVFAPGEAFQFDWSEDWAVIGGERMKLKIAHFKLAHSRAFTLRAYARKRTRCCSMRTIMRCVRWAASQAAACTTT
jgi:hypothetical protein